MKKDGLLAEILHVLIGHDRRKIGIGKQDPFLNQKKQLWFSMMNIVDEDVETPKKSRDDAQDS